MVQSVGKPIPSNIVSRIAAPRGPIWILVNRKKKQKRVNELPDSIYIGYEILAVLAQ